MFWPLINFSKTISSTTNYSAAYFERFLENFDNFVEEQHEMFHQDILTVEDRYHHRPHSLHYRKSTYKEISYDLIAKKQKNIVFLKNKCNYLIIVISILNIQYTL